MMFLKVIVFSFDFQIKTKISLKLR